MSTQFIEHKQLDEDYIDNLAYYCSNQLTYPDKVAQILNEIVYLAQHIGNLHDIHQILIQKRFSSIVKVADGYAKNVFVQYIAKQFYMHCPEKYLENKHILKGPQASKLLCSTFKAVQKKINLPMKSIIKANLIKGMNYNYILELFEIKENKALNFLATYFDVIDRNKNKPERRYLEFKGIAVDGLEYLHLKDWQGKYLVPREPFIMDGKTYDAYTGATNMIRKATEKEIEELFS